MKKRSAITRWGLIPILGMAAALLMVGGPASAYTTPANHVIIESGSDTSYYVMSQLDALYNQSPGCELITFAATSIDPQYLDFSCRSDIATTVTTENYRHNVIAPEAPVGSGNGKRQLCDITDSTHVNPVFIDYSRSSEIPGGCTGVHGVSFAKDAIAWECWPGSNTGCNGLSGAPKNLTVQNLIDIYTCVKTDWSQVGGAAGPITVYTAQAGSGTRKTWDAFLGNITEGPCVNQVFENQNADILAANTQSSAIYYTATSAFTFKKLASSGAQLGQVGGVPATTTNIQSGAYPFTRYIYNLFCDSTCPVTHGATSQAALDYMGVDDTFHSGNGWLCKAQNKHSVDPLTGKNYYTEIKATITKNGMVPLPFGATGGASLSSSFCREA